MFGKKKQEIKNIITGSSKLFSSSWNNLGNSIGNRFRMKGRIRLANRWARHNPKRFFVYFLVCIVSMIAVNESIYFLIKKHREKEYHSGMLAVRPVFEGRHRIEANREGLKMQISMLIDEGRELLTVLDSLNNIAVKTPSDSLEIYRVMKQIETISNILDNETQP